MSNTEKFFNLIKIKDCGLTKIRVGNEGDGGYVAYKELCEQSKVVYSFGVGNDVGFELAWVQMFPNSEIKLFDPIITALPKEHQRFTFQRYGIGLQFQPLDLVENNSTLKMDVEYDEWGALQIFKKDVLNSFSQILVEFHIIHVAPQGDLSPYFSQLYRKVTKGINQDLFAYYYDALMFLTNNFHIFHIHANNSLPVVHCDGFTFPPLLEMSLVRKDLVRGQVTDGRVGFPVTGLDVANKADRPDIVGYYPFKRISV